MKKITTIFGAILFASTIMISCNDSTTESDAKSGEMVSALEEAQQNSKSDFLALLSGKVYEMGEGENIVKVSFDTSGYLNDCGALGQVGWIGSYWADGPLFTVDVNDQEKELATHVIMNCTIDSKETYKIKYIDDNTISLTVFNCENDPFFNDCGPFTLKN